MTAKQITDKIALLKEAMKKEKIKSVKDKIKNKIEDLRQQAKTSNISTTQLAKSLLGSQRKVANMSDDELRSALKQLKPRSEYSFLKLSSYRSLPKVKDDLKRYAKPVGWRIKGKNNTHIPSQKELAIAKKKGTAYYEDRPNRADVVRPAKLEDGGMMAKGGIVAYANDDYENRIGAFSSKASAKTFAKKNVDKYDEITFEDKSGDSIVVSKGDTAKDIDWLFGESYSKMAKGGNVERGSAHLYITHTRGQYLVYHGDDVILKPNAKPLFERKGVEEGTWMKMWNVLYGTKKELK